MDESDRLPDVVLDDVALFLDIDGTLLDIAPRPDEVTVPKSLLGTLERLQTRTEGALALVSGRRLADIDRLFAPLGFAAAGGHGAEIRPGPDAPVDLSNAAPLETVLIEQIDAFCAGRKGVLVENKTYSVAVHFRLAPEQESAVRDGIGAICAQWPGSISILPGKSVIELKHEGFNKGLAVKALMKREPFQGRAPIYVGDDVTDEPAIAAMAEFHGFGLSVGRAMHGATYQFGTPADVRRWLQEIARSEPTGGVKSDNGQ